MRTIVITKVRHKREKTNPFGGISFIVRELLRRGVPHVIDKALGKRPKQSKYSISDIILGLAYSNFCGGKRIEDTRNNKTKLANSPNINIPSPDTVARVIKKLATKTDKFKSEADIEHEFNVNMKVNQMMLSVAKRLHDFQNSSKILDYDNVLIPAEKYDSKWGYKDCAGYAPGLASIDKTPVYIEGRNGNSSASYLMSDTLTRCLDFLQKNKIPIKKFRSDSAAYQKEVIELVDSRNLEFVIKAAQNTNQYLDYENLVWAEFERKGWKYQSASVEYCPFGGNKVYRLVFYKCLDRETKNENRFTGEKYVVFSIITNNWKMSDQDVLHFYSMRGKSEHNFKHLLNDFNWKRMPFSFLNENTAFLIIQAMFNVLYDFIVRKFSKVLPFVNPKGELKDFLASFITVVAWHVFENGEWTIEVDSMLKYERLLDAG